MKVLLIKDVYKLGRAGDVKKVADGYGRNYLLPQGMAVLATPGALKQIERIQATAVTQRAKVNNEMGGLADKITGLSFSFPVKAGETGKLYGSVTNQMIAEALSKKIDVEIDRRHIELQPIRTLGEYKANVRLTMDLTPEVTVIVYREGESDPLAKQAAVQKVEVKPQAESQAEEPAEPLAEEQAEEAQASS